MQRCPRHSVNVVRGDIQNEEVFNPVPVKAT